MIVCMNYKMLEYDRIDISEGIDDVAIASIKGNDYRIHFSYMNQNDAINLMIILV